MAAKRNLISRRRSNSLRSIRQQQTRRRNSLLRKSFEYCRECDADVFMMIRLRHNGQIVFFNSNSQWPQSREQLVGVVTIQLLSADEIGLALPETSRDNMARIVCKIYRRPVSTRCEVHSTEDTTPRTQDILRDKAL